MSVKHILPAILMAVFSMTCLGQDDIRLIIRGDDIASTHAANLGCIQSYQEGIMRSVEIMVPCPWFPEAVRMLNENPGLDVGVHLTFTSEWENMKWRPLTHAPSITDDMGFFHPMIWPNERFPADRTLKGSPWKLEEIEAEMRAQIELALQEIPQVSHLSCHMGCAGWDEEVGKLYARLAAEYDLDIDPSERGVKYFPGSAQGESYEERKGNFIKGLQEMEKGHTYLFVEHPALESMEMEAIGHDGYYTVNNDRQMVTELFTDKDVKAAIEKLGIRLISYADLVK